MWVSQSYLGSGPQGAHTYVYYFFEDYVRDQKRYSEQIEPYLSEFGLKLRHRVHLFGPNPIGHDNISNELLDKFQALWWTFSGKLPGLFITRKPLDRFVPDRDSAILLSLTEDDPRGALDHLREVIIALDLEDKTRSDSDVLRHIRDRISIGINIGFLAINFK